jgi:hypothetical protein
MGGHVPWSLTAGHSEGVRGIERGIELPVMPLANGTGEEVICHHDLLQSSPASGVIVWSLVKTLPDQKASKASFVSVMRNTESRGWCFWDEWRLLRLASGHAKYAIW